MADPKISVPETAEKGGIIPIRTVIDHPMDSGHNYDRDGKLIPRRIINTFIVKYNGEEVFHANLRPAQASNPYYSFNIKATTSGPIDFTWIDDDGTVTSATRNITVV